MYRQPYNPNDDPWAAADDGPPAMAGMSFNQMNPAMNQFSGPPNPMVQGQQFQQFQPPMNPAMPMNGAFPGPNAMASQPTGFPSSNQPPMDPSMLQQPLQGYTTGGMVTDQSHGFPSAQQSSMGGQPQSFMMTPGSQPTAPAPAYPQQSQNPAQPPAAYPAYPPQNQTNMAGQPQGFMMNPPPQTAAAYAPQNQPCMAGQAQQGFAMNSAPGQSAGFPVGQQQPIQPPAPQVHSRWGRGTASGQGHGFPGQQQNPSVSDYRAPSAGAPPAVSTSRAPSQSGPPCFGSTSCRSQASRVKLQTGPVPDALKPASIRGTSAISQRSRGKRSLRSQPSQPSQPGATNKENDPWPLSNAAKEDKPPVTSPTAPARNQVDRLIPDLDYDQNDLNIYDVVLVREKDAEPWGLTMKGASGMGMAGVLVETVRPGTPADTWNVECPLNIYKIKPGDLLMAVNGEVVDSTIYREKLVNRELKWVELLFMRPLGLKPNPAYQE